MATVCSRLRAEALRQLPELRRLGVGVDDAAEHAAGELAVVDFQDVGQGVVQSQALLQALGEEGEAAGDEQELDAVLSCRRRRSVSAPGDRRSFSS